MTFAEFLLLLVGEHADIVFLVFWQILFGFILRNLFKVLTLAEDVMSRDIQWANQRLPLLGLGSFFKMFFFFHRVVVRVAGSFECGNGSSQWGLHFGSRLRI